MKIELSAGEGEDSFSFMPLLLGLDDQYVRAPVVNHSSAGMFAIRDGAYKLVLGNGSGGRQQPKGEPWEKPYALFNLDTDIAETNNIIDQQAALAEIMEAKLIKMMDSGTSKGFEIE